MPRRQGGALLLMVSLLLATLAALAFGMNRAGGVELRSINDDYEGRAAAYLAEAGVAAARWSGQVGGCTYKKIDPTLLGAGVFTSTVKDKDEDEIDVTATGAVNGAMRTVTRTKLPLFDFKETKRVELSKDMVDTTIMNPSSESLEALPTLRLASGTSHVLMNWDLDDIDDGDVLVLSATLTLVPTSANSVARQVAVHRVTTQWDRSATWIKARPSTNWSGGNYDSAVLARADIGAAPASLDLTGLFNSWASKRVAAQGALLRLVGSNQEISFHSREATTSSRRPTLQVEYAEDC